MTVDDRLGRTLKLLQGSIRAAGLTQTDVDGRIGRRRGYLSHVFQRRVDLKLIDLLLALEALNIEPGRFFATVLGMRAEGRAALEDLVSLVADLQESGGNAQLPWQPPPRRAEEPALDDQQLLERVRQAVRSILAEEDPGAAAPRLGQAGGPRRQS